MEYQITYEPLEDPAEGRLPEEVQEQIERMHALSQSQPAVAVPELIDLVERYPNVRAFYNYLTVAYSALGQIEKMKATMQETLRRHPDYLFARVNYAELALSEGKLDEVAEIFDHKFDLKLLYPHRNKFHITEFVSFGGTVGSYFAAKGDIEVAERYYKTLHELEPEHRMTTRLRSAIHRARLAQQAKKLLNPFKWRRGSKDEPER